MRNRLTKTILLGIMAILLLSGWVYRSETGLADAQSRDGERLLDYAASQLSGGFDITLRLSGPAGGYANDDALDAYGRKLAGSFLPGISGALEHEGTEPYFRANGVMDGLGRIDVMVAGSRDQQSRFVIVRLDASSEAGRERLRSWQDAAERALQAEGVRGSWNVMAQGLLPSNARQDAAIIDEAARAFHGKAEERYTDDGTVSVSFDAADLMDAVQSGNHRISLQLAVRHLTGSGERRLTIGTPIITTEY